MPNLTDDPATYLYRDSNNVAIMLATDIESAQFQAKQYGVAIQVNMVGGGGIRAVTNTAEALAVALAYPQDTPWCIADSNLIRQGAYDVLVGRFGPPTTIDKALGVETRGIAWRPGQFRHGP